MGSICRRAFYHVCLTRLAFQVKNDILLLYVKDDKHLELLETSNN